MEAHRSIGGRLQRKPLGDCTNTVSRTSQQLSSSSASLVKFANPSLTSSLKRLVDQTSFKEKAADVNNSKPGAGIASRSVATSVGPVTRRTSADLDFPAPTPSRPPKPKDANQSEAGAGSASRSVATRVRPVTRRMSADLDFPAPTPSRPPKPKDVSQSEGGDGSASRSLSTSVKPVTRRMSTDLGFPASAPSRPQNSRSDHGVSDKEVAEPYSVYTVRRKASGKKRNRDESSSGAVSRLRLDLVSNSGKKTHQADENKRKPSKAAPKKRQRTVKHEEDNKAHGVSQDYIKQQKDYFAEVDAFELLEEEVSSSDLD
uniref:Sororin C-terminal region domain-containing protein n=1 Tax=Noccaea caerulescens TaxID=107243 RepID=A0A1J3JWP7_NOCCA